MDIFNRPPTIPEDTLQYTLHPPAHLADKASVTTFATCIQAHANELLPGFLWHRDAFELKVVSDPDVENGWLLEGRVRVGDCIDDEWCIVWLLKEISTKWDVVISVCDSDGEFLLIEAAEALPTWVKPTNSENRVWIHSGRLHLIPLAHVSPPSRKRRRRRVQGSDDEGTGVGLDDDVEDYIDIEDAVKLVRDPAINTLAPPGVENIVWGRIARYPEAAKDHVHVTKAYLPVDIARALSFNPSLVQKPVETFYTRDAIQLRAAHRMARFPPQPSVLTTVKMTRTAYAQLVGQKFYPPKIFGRWTEKEGSPELRWRDVGMKIACGFEMLYQESKGRADPSVSTAEGVKSSAEARKDALRRNPEYKTYIQNLVSASYFRGEAEGSQLWNELEDKAAETFVHSRREDDSTRPSFANMVTSAVAQTSPDIEPTNEPEDSDAWLNIDAQDFDDMLARTVGQNKPVDANAMDVDGPEGGEKETEEDRVAREQAERLQGLAKKVEEFVDGKGDLEGAKFDDEDSDDEDLSDPEDFSDEKTSDSDDDDEQPAVDPAERQAAMDKLVPGLEPSEYGQMPAAYGNSQRVAPTTIETDVVELLGPDKPPPASAEPTAKPIRQPILPRDKYDGVDSDDETDEEDDAGGGDEDEESEEDRPQVVGDVEVDMGAEEEEFLEFSRQALGISDAEWGDIIRDRKGRGAFVPSSVKAEAKSPAKPASEPKPSPGKEAPMRTPAPGPRPSVNPNLDSFEAVMQAMDAELAQRKTGKTKPSPAAKAAPPPTARDKGKGKAKATVEDVEEEDEEEDEDVESAMDAELKAILQRGGSGHDGDDEDETEEPMDYNLIKNFLESFKSQGGLSGPVSNLAGRLEPGWQLPRDAS